MYPGVDATTEHQLLEIGLRLLIHKKKILRKVVSRTNIDQI